MRWTERCRPCSRSTVVRPATMTERPEEDITVDVKTGRIAGWLPPCPCRRRRGSDLARYVDRKGICARHRAGSAGSARLSPPRDRRGQFRLLLDAGDDGGDPTRSRIPRRRSRSTISARCGRPVSERLEREDAERAAVCHSRSSSVTRMALVAIGFLACPWLRLLGPASLQRPKQPSATASPLPPTSS